MTTPLDYTNTRLSPDNAALLLIDHQAGIMQLVHDYSPVGDLLAVGINVEDLAVPRQARGLHLELLRRVGCLRWRRDQATREPLQPLMGGLRASAPDLKPNQARLQVECRKVRCLKKQRRP